MILKKILCLSILFLLCFCKEEKPTFYPELTEYSAPKEGILPYFKGEVMDPVWQDSKELPASLRRFPDITLLSDSNEAINAKSLAGKYTLVIFFYAKCSGICPMITRNVLNLLPKIGDQSNIQIISITVNPDSDTPEVLKQFRHQYKVAQTNWKFLTGAKNDIYELARKQFGADVKTLNGKDDLIDFVHTENVFLLDKESYLRGIYRAKGTGDLERLLVELKTLQEDNKSKL